MACFVSAKPPEVDASANPFSGMSMGAISTIYTAWTMVGGRRGRAADETSTFFTLTGMLCGQTRGGQIAPKLILFRSMIVEKSFYTSKQVDTAPCGAYLLQNIPQISSRMVIQILVKISHITMDLVASPASDRTNLGLGTQLCIILI